MDAQSNDPRYPARKTGRVAITNVTVIPMNTPEPLLNQTVVIEDGVISSVGPASNVQVEGARAIDGRGKYLMPGLTDMHVHYWDIGEFGMFLANGVTMVRNMWGSPFHLALQRTVREGRFPGPRVITTSPIIDGPGPTGTTIWPGSPMAADPAEAARLVREFAARGYQQTKAYSWLKLDVLRALGTASREAGIPMVGHCPDGITYEEAIDAGMTCFEHLTGVAAGRMRGKTTEGMRAGSMDALRTVVEHLDLDGIRRLASKLAEKDIWNCPTLVVWQGMSQEENRAMADPRLRYEPATLIAGWNPANDFRLRSQSVSRGEWLAMAQRRIELYLRVISILHEEGAPLLLGTDTPNPFVFQGFSIHDELANLVAAGLSPYQALRAGTADAARFVGEEAVWGTVEPGRRADLMLLGSNPLERVEAASAPLTVLVNGYVFSRGDLDALLAQRGEAVRSEAEPAGVRLAPTETGTGATTEGLLSEGLAGMRAGSIRYRHTHREDGSWLIEEARSSSADGLSSWGGVTFSRLELSTALHVLGAEVHGDSFLGSEGCQVQLGDDGVYVMRCTEIDGFETASLLPGPLPAGEELALTALPLLLRERPPDGTITTLGIDRAHAAGIPTEVSSGPNGWQVRVERAGTSAVQTYRFAPDGTLLDMEEQTWRGLRSITRVESVE